MSSTGSHTAAMAGFTLLELLVVIAIMSLGLALVPAILAPGSDTQSLKIDMRQIVSGLRFARTMAIVQNRPVSLLIDTQNRQVGIAGDSPTGYFARTTAIDVTAIAPGGTVGAIQFYPDGGSSGGSLTLSNDSAQYAISIDWLAGDVVATEE